MIKNLISFVIPCYRSEKTIKMVIDEIIDTVSIKPEFKYEIIAVNDFSPDRVYEVLKKIAAENSNIKVINFSKNMGKHAAVLAGYTVAQGEFVVDLDDDFQCPVNELWNLMNPLLNDECDYATAKYPEKKESLFKRLGSHLNFFMSTLLLDKPKGLRFENFSAMKRFVCEEIIKYKNPYPYLEGLVLRVTGRITSVEMAQRERGDDNRTGFTLKKSVSLWANGLTAFSVKPLRMASLLGVVFATCGFIWGIRTIILKLLNLSAVAGYSSLMASILFSSGIIMVLLGLIGEYLGRIYICINDSPQYVVRETINITPDDKKQE